MNSSEENVSVYHDSSDIGDDFTPSEEELANASMSSPETLADLHSSSDDQAASSSNSTGRKRKRIRTSTPKEKNFARFGLNRSAPATVVTCRSKSASQISRSDYRIDQDNSAVIAHMQRIDNRISLLDKKLNYVIALVEKGHKDIKTQVKEVEKRVDVLQSKPTSHEKTKEKIDVPCHIKSAVHDGYKSGVEEKNYKWVTKDGERIMKSISEENKQMSTYIQAFVKGLYSEADHGVIQAAIGIYFNSLKQREQKQRHGKDLAHKKTMLLYSRKSRKLRWRKAALKQKRGWEEEKKKKVMESLIMDFMSSEEEVDSGDETVFRTKPFQWRSDEFDSVCRDLDAKHLKIQSTRSKRQMVKRINGTVQSMRPKPNIKDSKHNWVLK